MLCAFWPLTFLLLWLFTSLLLVGLTSNLIPLRFVGFPIFSVPPYLIPRIRNESSISCKKTRKKEKKNCFLVWIVELVMKNLT